MTAWAWNAYPPTTFTGSTSGTFTITAPTNNASFGNLDLELGYNGNPPGSWAGHGVIPDSSGVYTWTEPGPGGAFTIDSADWCKATDHSVVYATWRATGSSATVTGAPGPTSVVPRPPTVIRRAVARASVI